MAANFCSNCGESVSENSHFCAKCGNQLRGTEVSKPKITYAQRSNPDYFEAVQKLSARFWFSVAAVSVILGVAIPSLNSLLSIQCDSVTFEWNYGTIMNGGWTTCYKALEGEYLSNIGVTVYSGTSLKIVEALVILVCLFWVAYLIRLFKRTAETE